MRIARIFTLIIALLTAGFLFAGCSSQPSTVDATGTWQSDPGSQGSYFKATVADGTIIITLVADDIEALYWKGTADLPNGLKDNSEFVSSGDAQALSESMFGSSEETKLFTYSQGALSFDFSMVGVNQKVYLKKV